ncbi:hypothetical protein PLICRDRAFT_103838 [Plicaturopsis crispa FD-325 SS-3]|nr:hypothetical protein PLICRDRAFT_103838 [Plicaturopsis crispa FD-325 SS-3]
MVKEADIRPSLSRRNSRPTSLHIDSNNWNADIVVEKSSPDYRPKPTMNGTTGHSNGLASPALNRDVDKTITPTIAGPSRNHADNHHHLPPHMNPAMKSPCFVHSHLDKGASLTEWLRAKQKQSLGDPGVAKPHCHQEDEHSKPVLHGTGIGLAHPAATHDSPLDEEDEEYGGSLTRQLAETAVGVREMSKQLGRARVRSNIQNVLIITKARDNRLIMLTRELALYLMLKKRPGHNRGLVVYVDNQLRTSRRFDAAGIERDHPELFVPFPRRRSSSSNSLASMTSTKDDAAVWDEGQLRYWTSDMCSRSPHLFDFVVTLGGDGTVLFTSWLFQRIVPPVLPFALGSLGFLTNFDFADHQAVMDSAIDSGIRVNLRMRFTCTVYRAVAHEKGKGRKAVKKGDTGEILMRSVEKGGGWEALEGGYNTIHEGVKGSKDKEIMCFTTRPVETFEIMNDLVVDRGPSPYVSLLELFGDEHHMTTVQADGLIVSTPTGSTAYSLSAGGSLVHPEIPSILISPICPHTLSFRPMLLPDSMELRICVPFNSRSTAWASFDGRGRVELKQGDHITVKASKYPFPTVCADKQSTDWFHAISRTLKWNERERQKSFVVVEEGPARQNKRQSQKSNAGSPDKAVEPLESPIEDEEDEVSDEDEEEEEDKFDIDDSSPEAAMAAAEKKAPQGLTPQEHALGRSKAREGRAEAAADALSEGNAFMRATKARSRSPSSGLRSGIDTPDRFSGPHPHPPPVPIRHPLRAVSPDSESYDSLDDMALSQQGVRDDIHASRLLSSGRSRIPKDRDVDAESQKTPTVSDLMRGHRRVNSKDSDVQHPRAFAVWGQDESDSNASDSDA